MLTTIQKEHIDVLYEGGMEPEDMFGLVEGASKEDIIQYCSEKC